MVEAIEWILVCWVHIDARKWSDPDDYSEGGDIWTRCWLRGGAKSTMLASGNAFEMRQAKA